MNSDGLPVYQHCGQRIISMQGNSSRQA